MKNMQESTEAFLVQRRSQGSASGYFSPTWSDLRLQSNLLDIILSLSLSLFPLTLIYDFPGWFRVRSNWAVCFPAGPMKQETRRQKFVQQLCQLNTKKVGDFSRLKDSFGGWVFAAGEGAE